MSFIGIIAEPKYEMNIKKYLNSILNSSHKDYTVIAINDKSIDNLRNIRFETILILTLGRILGKEDILNELLKNCKYVVINADMMDEIKEFDNVELNIITFGFNTKSTITASSVEENFLICVQRKIIDINKKIIEPQEINVKFRDENLSKSSHNLMGIAAIVIIYGKIEKFF